MIRNLVLSVVFVVITSRAIAQDGWLHFRGNIERTGAASSLPKWATRPAWERPLLRDGEKQVDPDDAADQMLTRFRADVQATPIPGFYPLILNGRCYYRSYCDVRSVWVQPVLETNVDGGVVTKTAAREIAWKGMPTPRSLAVLLENKETRKAMSDVIAEMRTGRQSRWAWANPMTGVLSADENTIYTIDDFAFLTQVWNPRVEGYKQLFALSKSNGVHAYDAATGKLKWELVGKESEDPELRGGYFLGPPLPIGNSVYLLQEKLGALRLIILNIKQNKMEANFTPKVQLIETLMAIPFYERIERNPWRRTQPLHMAGQYNFLLYPTNMGVLINGFQPEAWQYRYREANKRPPTAPCWEATCPIIHKKNIVFTAADDPNIHCLDLEGNKQWVARQEGSDLYLATVTDDIVLIVGKSHCRALSLLDGATKWTLEMGLPAGVGVRDGSQYFLPLKRDVITDGATIWGIDLKTGKKARRVQVPYPKALGNLALHRGLFVSQSLTHIAAFPLGVDVK